MIRRVRGSRCTRRRRNNGANSLVLARFWVCLAEVAWNRVGPRMGRIARIGRIFSSCDPSVFVAIHEAFVIGFGTEMENESNFDWTHAEIAQDLLFRE